MITGLLNQWLSVYRATWTDDGMGGRSEVWALSGMVRGVVAQPTAKEREEAQSWAAELTHTVYAMPGADIRRGDEIRSETGERFRVLAAVTNSRATYTRVPVERVQPEGE